MTRLRLSRRFSTRPLYGNSFYLVDENHEHRISAWNYVRDRDLSPIHQKYLRYCDVVREFYRTRCSP